MPQPLRSQLLPRLEGQRRGALSAVGSPSPPRSGAKGSGETRLLVQSWPKTNSEELIKRRGRSRGGQAGLGKTSSKGRAVRESKRFAGAETRADRHKEKEGTQSVGGAQPGEP